jgi:hypothetical protein
MRLVPRSIDIVAQAQVEGQIPAEPEIVLHVCVVRILVPTGIDGRDAKSFLVRKA